MDHVIKPEATMACRHEPGLEALALPSATLDAMKSFIVLADTQNLSEAVRILGLTRQTIRRHINLIEDIRGVVLFTLESGAYRLSASDAGHLVALGLQRLCAILGGLDPAVPARTASKLSA